MKGESYMRYYVKENLIAYGDKYIIKDEMGNKCYQASEKLLNIGNKIKLLDNSGKEVIQINQARRSALPEYKILMNSKEIGQVKKNFASITNNLSIKSIYGVYRLEGELINHNFTILDDLGNKVVSVSSNTLTHEDNYFVDIDDNINQAFMLAVIIIIDSITHNENK